MKANKQVFASFAQRVHVRAQNTRTDDNAKTQFDTHPHFRLSNLTQILTNTHTHKHTQGDVVIKEGVVAEHFYVIIRGQADVMASPFFGLLSLYLSLCLSLSLSLSLSLAASLFLSRSLSLSLALYRCISLAAAQSAPL